LSLLKQLTEHKLYLVGGAVRDHFLKIDNDDIDIAIECNEAELGELEQKLKEEYCVMHTQFFPNFGVLMVRFSELDGVGKTPGYKVELTMTRTEMYRGKDRNPIVKPASILEDLSRRDFTCNAIAYDLRNEVFLDPFNGVADIQGGILTPVPGNDNVFIDDPLRILRAFRFAQKFGLRMSSTLTKRIRTDAAHLSWLSKERIHDELIKMAELKGFSESCRRMMDLGVLPLLLPKLNQLQFTYFPGAAAHKHMWAHTLTVVERIDAITNDPILKIAALLHDCGKPMTAQHMDGVTSFHRHEQVGAEHAAAILPLIGFGKKEIERITNIINMHQLPVQVAEGKDKALRRFVNKAGFYLEDLLTLAECDYTTNNPTKQQACAQRITDLRERIVQLQEQDDYINFKLKLKGDRIAQLLEIERGPELGRVIAFLQALVLDGLINNDQTQLEQIVTHYKESMYVKRRPEKQELIA